jgi:cell division GTPase FtsZ
MKDGKLFGAVVGLGACGTAIAEVATISGLGQAFAFNTSAEDLDAAAMIVPQNKFKFQTAHGAAKDRNVAFKAFEAECSRFIQNVVHGLTKDGEQLDDYDFIFVISSGGGGTGSGIIPVVSRIFRRKMPNTFIIPVVVFPANYERGIVHENALACLRELSPSPKEAEDPNYIGFSIILADNNRVEKELIEEKYNTVNKEIVSNLKRLIYCEKKSKISNMDVADRKAMFSDPGILIIGSATIEPEEESPLSAAVKRALEATPMVADLTSSVKRVALQYECDKSLYTQKNIIAANNIFKNVAGIFEGYYEADVDDSAPAENTKVNNNRVLVALSGARLPEKDIKARESVVEDTFKQPTEDAVEISKGNASLNNAWRATTKPVATADSAAENESYDDLFNSVGSMRQ